VAQGDWASLSVGNLRAHLPLAMAERARCASCAERCRLALADGGTFAVFEAPLPEAWPEARDRFAPETFDRILGSLQVDGSNGNTSSHCD
jgi:hypothetical protein